MARSGGFGGGSLRPFGSLGTGFAQYSIGKTSVDLAALRRYEVEIRWSNGQASDAEYLAALQGEIAATDPDTEQRIAAQNKLDDAVFSIGRSHAQNSGDPETLIAFDAAALSKMTPGNKRYDDLRATLDAELADRRSRAYGHLVDAYQAGTAATQTLLDWVNATVAGLPAGAPDADNWRSAAIDLKGRLQGEKDAKVDQDYQHQRITPAAYVSYLTNRRDAYLTGSPLYQQWASKVEDAITQARNAELARQDSEFFAAYNRGAKGDPGDPEYLAYIRQRIAGMKPDDPNLPDWQHRLETSVMSIAEDKLIADVNLNHRPAADLVAFYKHYALSLNPDSPEYRSVIGKIHQWEQTSAADQESWLRFQVEHPGVTSGPMPAAQGAGVSVGGSPYLPTAGSIAPPAGAKFGGIAGGHYSPAELDYVANRMAQLTGLDPSVTRLWALKEEGGGNNPYGVSGVGSAGHSGIRANFTSIDEGITAAATWVNTHGNMAGIKNAVGKSVAAQIDAIDRSPWGPGGGRGGYNGSLIGLAKGNLRAPAASAPAGTGPAVPAPGSDRTPAPSSDNALRNLIAFYQDQVNTLPHDSPEWRSAFDKLTAAQDSLATGDKQGIGEGTPIKAIDPRANAATIVHQLAIGPTSSPYAVANYQLNHDSLNTAWKRGDKVWLYFDPAAPDATTFAREPDGSYALDDAGKRIQIRGSGYYPVTTEAVARVEQLSVSYYQQMSEAARAAGQHRDAVDYQNKAINALDTLRGIDSRVAMDALDGVLNGDGRHGGIASEIDHAWAVGDLAGVVNASAAAIGIIEQLRSDPTADAARRDQLATKRDSIAANPLFPDPAEGREGAIDFAGSMYHTDASGQVVYDEIALLPLYHHVIDMSGGKKTTKIAFDGEAPGVWEQTHVPLHLQFGDTVQTLEAPVDTNSPISTQLAITVHGMPRQVNLGTNAPLSVTFFDGSGTVQTAYSLDGSSWIRSNAGLPPMAQLVGDITRAEDDGAGGLYFYQGPTAEDALMARMASGGIEGPVLHTDASGVVKEMDQSKVEWFGQSAAVSNVALNPLSDARVAQLYNAGASAVDIRAAVVDTTRPGYLPSAVNTGAPGQSMTIAFSSPDGSINMLPPDVRILPDVVAQSRNDILGRTAAAIAALPGPRASLSDITPNGVLPAPPRAIRPFAPIGVAPDARLALASQLPPDTPARVPGSGLAAGVGAFVRPLPPVLPPVSPTRLAPVPVEVKPLRNVVSAPPPPKPVGLAGEGPLPVVRPKPKPIPATELPKLPKAIPSPVIPRSGPAVPL